MTLIVYLDTSAILKQYFNELYSHQTVQLLKRADYLGSTLLLQVEFSSGIAKASRMHWIEPDDARLVINQFHNEVGNLQWISVDNGIVNRASELAWKYGLRGY